MLYNRCDVHTHTLFSRHAYSTIQENVSAAAEAGLELLGSADHFGNMLFAKERVQDFQFFYNVEVWPRLWKGVRLLRACEADIVDLDGHLFGGDIVLDATMLKVPCEPYTLAERVFRSLDYIVASIHNKEFTREATLAQTTNMYVEALAHPKVLVLGHPGRAGVPFEIDPVLTQARDLHKLVEINEHTFGMGQADMHERCRQIALRAAELGVGIVISSDAHICTDIGKSSQVLAMLEEIHFPQELIATRSAASFIAAGHEAGLMSELPAELDAQK